MYVCVLVERTAGRPLDFLSYRYKKKKLEDTSAFMMLTANKEQEGISIRRAALSKNNNIGRKDFVVRLDE